MERLEHSYKITLVKRVVFVSISRQVPRNFLADLIFVILFLNYWAGGGRGYNHVIDFENVLPICYLIIGVVQSAVYPEEGTNITMSKSMPCNDICTVSVILHKIKFADFVCKKKNG